MDVGEALSIIKIGFQQNLIESKHFLDQCKDRNLNVNSVKKVIKNNDLLGILEQGEIYIKFGFSMNDAKI